MALVRVRSRDGLERVTVPDPSSTTVARLKSLIESQLGVPASSQSLSLDRNLLLPSQKGGAAPLPDSASLPSLGVSHGSVLFLLYEGDRQVPGGPRVSPAGSFGNKMTMDDLIARQVRVSRQETPHADCVSLDRSAADAFQRYASESLAFSVKRGGFMYGRVVATADDGNNVPARVEVDFIYEPPQRGTEEELFLLRDPDEEAAVEAVAVGLGVRRVGFLFTQAVGREMAGKYTMSRREVLQAAGLQAEGGVKEWVTAVVKLEVNEEGGADVHFEAFQMSDVCVRLLKEGWFEEEVGEGADPRVSRTKKDVVVGVKDTQQVDNDFFLVLVKISDHQDKLTGKMIGGGREERGVYRLSRTVVASAILGLGSAGSPLQWEHRLGHLPIDRLKLVLPHIPSTTALTYDACQLGKTTGLVLPHLFLFSLLLCLGP